MFRNWISCRLREVFWLLFATFALILAANVYLGAEPSPDLPEDLKWPSAWSAQSSIAPRKYLRDFVNFSVEVSGMPVITFYNVCATMRSLTFLPTIERDARLLKEEISHCCGHGRQHDTKWAKSIGDLCLPRHSFGEQVNYSSPCGRRPFALHPFLRVELKVGNQSQWAQYRYPGRTLFLDTAIDWWQYGHTFSRFVQAAVMEESKFDRIYFPKMARPPYKHNRERNLLYLGNLTLGQMNLPLLFGGPIERCFDELFFVPDYEKAFWSCSHVTKWRELVRDHLGIQLGSCPPSPARVILLQRSSKDISARTRHFTNPHVIDEVAAELGIQHVERVTISSENSTEVTAQLFSSVSLIISPHSSQLKNLFFSAPHTAVVEITGAFLCGDCASPFELNTDLLGLHYRTSKFHSTNMTACGQYCAGGSDKNAPVTVNRIQFKEALQYVLDRQKANCPHLYHST